MSSPSVPPGPSSQPTEPGQPAPPSPAPAAAPDRIVCALSAADRHTFLPGFDPAIFAPADFVDVDIAGLAPADWGKLLAERRPTILVTGWGSPVFPAALVEAADLPLRYWCHLVGSVKPFVPRRLLERGVAVSNWGASVSHLVAEHALLLILAALRNLPAWEPFLRTPLAARPGRYDALRTRTLHGRRVGLHGFGVIARALTALLRPFDVQVAAFSEGVPPELYDEHGVARADSLEELFAGSEVLVECEALTDRTRGRVDGALLRLLPEDAVFINVGRGAVVDEAALLALAVAGRLRVGLDVFAHEPPPHDSPWFGVPGVLCSPHIGGPTHDLYPACGGLGMENIRRFLAGEPIEGQVTLASYDRST